MPDPHKIELVVGRKDDGAALYTAMGAALVGVILGGIAVWMGLQSRSDALQGSAAKAATSVAAATAEAAKAEPVVPAPPPEERRGPVTVTGPVDLADAVERTRDAVVCLSFAPPGGKESFAGAGVIYDQRGLVLTNHHVIEPMLRSNSDSLARLGGGGQLTARFVDGRVREATVLFNSPEEDLAILKLAEEGDDPKRITAEFGQSSQLRVGETVFAVGCPVGLDHTVSAGIVSALNRTGVMPNRFLPTIQLDAAINLGNSGGPLFDSSGALVGITSARSSRGQGIGFAIPIDRVRVYLRALYQGEAGRSGVIGATITAEPETRDSLAALGYLAGLTVDALDDEGPASKAGMRVGDIIVEVRGRRLDGGMTGTSARLNFLREFMDVARNLLPGEELSLTVARAGKLVPVSITVQAASDEEQSRFDVESVFGLRLYESAEPKIVGFLPGSRLEGDPQAQRLLLDHKITLVGSQEIRTVADLGAVAATLKPVAGEGRGRRVRMRLESPKGEAIEVTYPLDWRR